VEESTPVVDGAKLLIVESATKARTIQKFLPQGWEVDFCMGHVRELPRSLSDMPPAVREKTEVVGVRVKQAFEPMWVVLPSREPVVNRLKEKAAACSELYLATDEDREGEAISWHLVELLKPTVPVKRVVFHEITPSAVQGGLDQPREIDQSLVEAQHARRVLDRVAGYTMSPLLWRKIGMGLSAGRVQSVGLKLLIDRERERMLFRSAQFAALKAALRAEGWDKDLEARLQALNGKRVAIGADFDPRTGQLAEKRAGEVVWVTAADMPGVAQQLESPDTRFRVVGVDTKVVSRRRPAPFTTSTLQQDANSRLGLSSAQTMKLAQELYEEGYISYMRTDNPNMGPEAHKVRSEGRRRMLEPIVLAQRAGCKQAWFCVRGRDLCCGYRLTPASAASG
jgi:DNA topoisomerase-1